MKTFKQLALSICVLSGLLTLSACQSLSPTAQQTNNSTTQTPQSKPLRLLQNIHEHTFDNGLKVIIKEDNKAPVVMTQIWYGVGAYDEPVGKGGLSHFLEHLMFKDTPKVSGDDLSRLISHYGGSLNAYTSTDVTVYHELLPANRYPLALEIEANRMKNVLFKPDQIQSERQVVQEERRVRTDDNPFAKAYEQVNAFMYGDTPRARPIIGSMADIDNLSMDDLKHWYTTWYVPNNATIVIVGDVDKDEALSHVKRYFGDIPKGDPVPTRNPADFIHPDDLLVGKGGISNRHLVVKEAVQVPVLILSWQAPSLSSLKITGHFNDERERELMALGLFDDVLSGGSSSRFAKNLVKKELVTSATSMYDPTSYGDAMFTVVATPRAGVSLDETKSLILNEIKNTLDTPIAQKELDRSMVSVKSALVFASEGVSGQAGFLGSLSQQGIPYSDIQRELDIMPTIGADELKNAAKKYLKDERMYSIYVLPKDN